MAAYLTVATLFFMYIAAYERRWETPVLAVASFAFMGLLWPVMLLIFESEWLNEDRSPKKTRAMLIFHALLCYAAVGAYVANAYPRGSLALHVAAGLLWPAHIAMRVP